LTLFGRQLQERTGHKEKKRRDRNGNRESPGHWPWPGFMKNRGGGVKERALAFHCVDRETWKGEKEDKPFFPIGNGQEEGGGKIKEKKKKGIIDVI